MLYLGRCSPLLKKGNSLLRLTASFSSKPTLDAPRPATKVETYPRPVSPHLRSYIKQEDMVHDFGQLKLIRARLDHIVLLMPLMYDFIQSEPSCQTVGFAADDEFLWPFLYNCTRYPFSFFAMNEKDEIVALAFHDVVYRDNSKDPHPRLDIVLSDQRHPFHLVGAVLAWGEQRHFELLGVEKFLHGEIVYTPSVLRRQKVSATILPYVLGITTEEAPKMGLRWNVGICTGEANTRNMEKMHFALLERIPAEIYKDFDGKPWKPNGEEPAMLVSLDMELAAKKKIFGTGFTK